ncbi:hypothetical protein I6F26_10220 [Ensifer sp. IC3342]|nr:hypothetical protein [Ensifer sp. BRP08]MCA1446954.1 hypothetical protein [Ensifer sp. IC3342]
MTETRRIEALYGPYRGFLDVPADVAEQAIKDGWARDPFATPDPDAPPPELPTQEKLDAMIAAAEKAARKLRGEEPPKAKPKKDEPKNDEPKTPTRQSTAETDQSAAYKTRSSTPKE